MNNENSVFQVVLETVHKHCMISKGDKILAAVSGGADSVCMLHVLNSMKDSFGVEIYCAHLNHGLRGDDAVHDEEFVKTLCGRLGIPVFTRRVDVAALAMEKKLTTEEAGRLARYEFFRELSEKYGINKTATAHNKNDNAETVLMRILRGTGIDGLKGIEYVRCDNVIRPLLDVSRCEIEKYCAENGLEFCTDATNADNDYTRNKIRNKLIPFLEQEFNPEAIDSINRLSRNAAEDAAFMDGYARRLYARLCNPLPSKRPVTLHIDSMKMADSAIVARVIRIAADEAVPGIKLERKHILDIIGLMSKPTGTEISLPLGLKASVRYGWISFDTGQDIRNISCEVDNFFTTIGVGDTVFVESLGKDISLRTEDAKTYKCKVNETYLSYDLIEGQMLFLRSRRSGDRIVWFPDGRTKKIKNILIDDKIPQPDRNKIPLLCTGSEVLAIVGSRVSEKYKVTDETERALVIEYGLQKQSQDTD